MKKILLKNIGVGLLLYVVFNIVLFSLAMVFGFEDSNTGPTLASALVFAVIIGLIVWGFLKWMKPKDQKEAWGYSLSWAGIVTTILVIVTVANDTTGLFFGKWFNWLPLITMAVVPAVSGFLEDKLGKKNQ